MSIKYAEERALGPCLVLTSFRLQNVQDDADSVLVHLPDDAFVGVGGVCSNTAVLLCADFAGVDL